MLGGISIAHARSVIEEGKRLLQALRMHTPELRVRGISPDDLRNLVQSLEASETSVLTTRTNLVNERSTRNGHKGETQKAMRYLKGHIRNEFNTTDPVYQTVFGKTTTGRSTKAGKANLIKPGTTPPESAENTTKVE